MRPYHPGIATARRPLLSGFRDTVFRLSHSEPRLNASTCRDKDASSRPRPGVAALDRASSPGEINSHEEESKAKTGAVFFHP